MVTGNPVDESFLGRALSDLNDSLGNSSEDDTEIRRLLCEAQDDAWAILTRHRRQLEALVVVLIAPRDP